MVILAPIAAGLLQMALSRSREYEADRSGAELIGTGEPLASALLKIEAYAKQVPMDIDPAHATAYIINPLSGRKGPLVSFDCATVPESLLQAALFGSVKGAYTGSIADRAGVFEPLTTLGALHK